jgi:hypothetical protein
LRSAETPGTAAAMIRRAFVRACEELKIALD